MPRRNRKNGKFSKQTRRTRRTKTTSVLKVAETALMADAITKGVFNADLRSFLMSEVGAANTSGTKFTQITLRELLSGATGGDYGTQYSGTVGGKKSTYGNTFSDQIMANVKANGLMMAFNLLAIPIAFKIGKQVLSKPLINPMNRQIRALGVKQVKV
jgi:hypothetical protein